MSQWAKCPESCRIISAIIELVHGHCILGIDHPPRDYVDVFRSGEAAPQSAHSAGNPRSRRCAGEVLSITTVRLNVEENQLVNAFGEFGICLGGLKGA